MARFARRNIWSDDQTNHYIICNNIFKSIVIRNILLWWFYHLSTQY